MSGLDDYARDAQDARLERYRHKRRHTQRTGGSMSRINVDYADRIRRDTIGNDLQRAAEIDRRNARNLAHWHHRKLAYVMGRVQENLSGFVTEDTA